MIVDRFKLADVFGVGADTCRTWVRSGCPVHQEPRTGKGVPDEERKRLFCTAAVHRWLLRRSSPRFTKRSSEWDIDINA